MYHQISIKAENEEVYTLPPTVPAGELVAVRTEAASIRTDVYSGPVEVRVQLHQHAPGQHHEGWDETAETQLVTTSGRMQVMGYTEFPPDELPILTPQGPGRYGLRVHTRHGSQDELQQFLVVAWPLALGIDALGDPAEEAPASLSDRLVAWGREFNDPLNEPGRLHTRDES